MKHPQFTSIIPKIILLVLLFMPLFNIALAQEEEEEPLPPAAGLVISDTDVAAIPSIRLRLYGRDEQGNAIDFSQSPLSIQSNGIPVGPVSIQGTTEIGTFTIFLIDIPTGVSGQLPAIEDAIQGFSAPPFMKEQVDFVSVYQVGVTGPKQLLEPVQFHNSVRNLFVTPLTPETGATALLDSTVNMLEQIESLMPVPGMAASIVLITDGTDAVSTENLADDVIRAAAELDIPVHTIWLLNEDLGDFSRGFGQEYLESLAAGSGGVAVRLGNTADLAQIWSRITEFRVQTLVTYTAAALSPGEATITVALADEPSVRTETAVLVPDNIPSITIDLSADARTLSLPNVDDPVTLHFNTTLQWLDGVERTLEAAQLVVNGEIVAEIPVNTIDSFNATTDQFAFGNNSVELVVLDEQGFLARSPEIVLTVEEGARNIPTELAPSGRLGGRLGTFLVSVVLLGIAAAVWTFAWRSGWLSTIGSFLPRGRRRRPASASPQVTITDEDVSYSVSTQPLAYLEVISAQTHGESEFGLRDLTVRIGRSPSQSDITFNEDITVSRLHATMRLEGNHYRIYDEKSTSGTWVNDRQVPEYGAQLQNGDEIHLGGVHLRFRQE